MPASTPNTPNSSRNTCSNSRGRRSRRGSSSTSPYARQQSPARPGCFSPSQHAKLPAGRGSRHQQQQSHSSGSDFDSVSTPSKAPNPSDINEIEVTLIGKGDFEDDDVGSSNEGDSTPMLGASFHVSDNTGSEAAVPLPTQSDKSDNTVINSTGDTQNIHC